MIELMSLTPEEMQTLLPGHPSYRARQIFRWLQKGVRSFSDMTDVPAALHDELAALGTLTAPEPVRRQTARDGTQKTLWQLDDGQCVESVLMKYRHGHSLCLSTQAGCRMGCLFCASTVGGLVRHLTAAEMMAQVLFSAQLSGREISNLVLMGIGEPLDNFEQVTRFLTLLAHPEGRHMSLRHVSLSTCGLIDGIYKLAELSLPVTLSVSLHAPDDETRNKLMPINREIGVAPLLRACRDYFHKTGRRVSYEYILLDGINDSPEQAHLLGKLLRGEPAHVNLIPYNPAGRGALRASLPQAVKTFQHITATYGPAVTLRRSLGQDIAAACGQLRRASGAGGDAQTPGPHD